MKTLVMFVFLMLAVPMTARAEKKCTEKQLDKVVECLRYFTIHCEPDCRKKRAFPDCAEACSRVDMLMGAEWKCRELICK